ncbi:MFS transporter [Mycobacterium montefiorense]|uniref:MFS transporter n=1 Tax=Mycobacterium montefiorense TaxID=154654 RepID=A0AA37V1M5_9MYCO|nr:MFS transporter [Mycobacterium montefiorense]GKU36681.1 MFS transporter [Mycobacterium montefiorense]GKU38040.1 MFS transporter [Mycobacterium montefiorense]GKU47298.1 MFS transporter [Mycobacterium montefiorense]GKU50445.1 MFS transporter [Mycobacterium montefiorense]
MGPQVLLHGEGLPRASSTAAAVLQVNWRVNILRMVKRVGRSRHLSHWDAEDLVAWEAGGNAIARRNLFWSAVIVHLGYAIWALWPVMALFMPREVYGFSAGDKLLLGMTATLVGACLRPTYAVATAIFGGRNLAVFSAFVLVIPVIGAMVLLAHPGLPLWPYLVCAALSGMGGGNFAASASNANSFYPHRLKGAALGIAGGIGNLGVPMIQIAGLVVIAIAGDRQPYWVCGLYLVLLITAGVGATFFMNNVAQHRVEPSRLRSILSAVVSTRDTWLLSLLYLGTFGSFIGFSFAFAQVLQTSFVAGGQATSQASLHAAELAFIGPLLAALARVYGGRLADRIGGGRVTCAVFVAMILSAAMLITVGTLEDPHAGPVSGSAMAGYVACFIALFTLAGLGNGSVYKMVPTVFETCSQTLHMSEAEQRQWSRLISGVVIGFVAGFGSLGGVGINVALRQSYVSTGTMTSAFWIFLSFYVFAAVLTWVRYVRRPLSTSAQQAVGAG